MANGASVPWNTSEGEPKENDADRLQLCGQAMCLEEMLACQISEGNLFYDEIRRREKVAFTPELRQRLEEMLSEMRGYDERGYTPRVKRTKACNACSLKELCLPELEKLPTVAAYLSQRMKEDKPCESF